MEAASSRYKSLLLERLATLVCGALILGSFLLAIWTPVNPGFTAASNSTGQSKVARIMPDGPAWNLGVVPGDSVEKRRVGRDEATTYVFLDPEGRRTVLSADIVAPKPLDVLVVGLGLCLLLLGHLVLRKGRDVTTTKAFHRMSLVAALGLGLVPAGRHGIPWALALDFASIRLFGPALVGFALTVTFMSPGKSLRFLLWLPALVLVLLYPLCWWYPIALFPVLQTASYTVLAGYCLAAVLLVCFAVSRRTIPTHLREQFFWLCIGLGGGIAPFTLLTLLPLTLSGKALLPGESSILALVLLPLCVSVAVARTEFMGIASLLRRRTLRLLSYAASITVVASVTGWLAATGPQRWGWSASSIAVGASLVSVASFALLWPKLRRHVERLMLSDAYDTEETVLHLSAELARTVPQESGQVAVNHARVVMDVTFSLLLTPDGEWWSVHPQSPAHDTLQIDVVRHARELLNVPSQTVASSQESVSVRLLNEQTILFLPVRAKHENLAVLCMGPKRSEDLYTDQDRSLLGTLCYQLAVKLQEQHLHTRMVEQGAKLRALDGDSEPLTAREMEILPYAAQGLANKEIARKLMLHTRTVEKRFTSIFRKWGVRSRQEAVQVAQQKGLIPLASSEEGDGKSGS